MTKRYWVKLRLELYNYDEKSHTVTNEILAIESNQLTPEPTVYVRENLAEQAERIASAVEEGKVL